MEKILKRCCDTVDVASKKEIPDFVWKKCKGVAIINISEVGFVFSVQEGDGVVLKHNDDGTWGAPSALMFTGSGGGAVLGGAHKQILLFPMTEHGLKMLTGTKFELGAQVGLAAGPIGREASVGLEAGNKGVGYTLFYVFEEGVFMSIGINEYILEPVPEYNQGFYGKQEKATDIVMKPGTVTIPKGKGVEDLHARLSKLSKK